MTRLCTSLVLFFGLLLAACSEEIVVDATYRRDLEPPGVVITSPTNGEAVLPPFTVSGYVSDFSGISNVILYASDAAGGPVYSFATTVAGSNFSAVVSLEKLGNYVLYATACDLVGNLSNSRSVTAKISGDAVYVAPDGDDEAAGNRNAPLRTIQTAVDRAGSLGISNVYVKSGTYTPGAGLNQSGGVSGISIVFHNIRLIGGWNSDFTVQSGKSFLDAMGVLKHVVYVEFVKNIYLDGFVVMNGNANGSDVHARGGGICFFNVYNSLVSNMVVSNNQALSYGGGVTLYYSTRNILYCEISSNYSKIAGGVSAGTENSIFGLICSNRALIDGGGIVAGHHSTISARIVGNCAGSAGGAVVLTFADNSKLVDSIITNNVSANSVIWLQSACLSGGNSTVISNNTIGGTNNASVIGIAEFSIDTKGLVLVNNKFISGCLGDYYRDFVNGGTVDMADVNNAGWSGAATASGNTDP